MHDTIYLNETSPESPEEKEYYPEVSISNPELVNFPNNGKAVIEFEVKERTHRKIDEGSHQHTIRFCIKAIRPMGRKKSSVTNAAERAMEEMLGEE